MRPSLRSGREEVVARLQKALSLSTKKEAAHTFDTVVGCIENTLLHNLGSDGFTIKLNGFGKLSVRHRPGILRKIPFTGEVKQIRPKRKIRFVSLGSLRQSEVADSTNSAQNWHL